MGPPGGFGGTPGVLRFVQPNMSGQITWLFPLAILGGLAAGRPVRPRRPLGLEQISLLLWGGWLATHWIVFSFARGIFHEYYTTVMGPPLAALAGIGSVKLLDQWRQGKGKGWLPAAVLLTAAWQAYVVWSFPGVRRWFLPVMGAGAFAAIVGLILSNVPVVGRRCSRLASLATCIGMTSLMLGPAYWSWTTANRPGFSVIPTAGPRSLARGPGGRGMPPGPPMMGPGMTPGEERNEKLVSFLRANRRGERIFVAAPSSMEVSSIIIHSGEGAVSLGGFMGADPVVTKEEFARMVGEGEIRFVLLGGGPGGGGGPPMGPGGPGGGMPFPPGVGPPMGPGGTGNAELLAWIRENGQSVDAEYWRREEPPPNSEPPSQKEGPNSTASFARRMRMAAQLFDFRPELGLVKATDIKK